jgi:hypothetical protein
MSHTPGPWIVEEDVRHYSGAEEMVGYNIVAPGDKYIAGPEGILPDNEADARLIAAAPDLLEACKAAEWNSLDLPASVVEQLRAAITKATGETL